jgi:hypothetical protein
MPDQDSPAPPRPTSARTLWSQTLERWLLRRPAAAESDAASANDAAPRPEAGSGAAPPPAWADPMPLAA